MNPSQHLGELHNKALRRLARLRFFTERAIKVNDELSCIILSHIVIEAHNVWTLFSRAFYLSCALSARRISGAAVTSIMPDPKSINNAIDQAMRYLKPHTHGSSPWPRRDEPAWQAPRNLIALSMNFNFSNFTTITAALSITPRVFDHLKDFRHFFAHRNEDTMQSAMGHSRVYGIAGIRHPNDFIRTYAIGRPQPILVDWIDDLITTIDMLCQ